MGSVNGRNRAAFIGCIATIAFGVLAGTVMAVAKWSSNHRMAVYPNPCHLCDLLDYITGAIGLVMAVLFIAGCFMAINRADGCERRR